MLEVRWRPGLALLAGALLTMTSAAVAEPPADEPGADPDQCTASIGVPYQITLSAAENAIAPGATVTLQGSIDADAYFNSFRVSLSAQGPVELLGAASFDLGSVAPGGSITFEIPVRYTAQGRAAVMVRTVADEASAGPNGERTEGFYAILDADRTLAGMGSYLNLEIRDVEDRYQSGTLTMEEARTQLKEVTEIPAQFNSDPGLRSAPNPAPGAATLALPPVLSTEEQSLQAEPVTPTGTVTVQGNVSWLDENGVSHPCYGMHVEVRDDELIGSDLVADMITGSDGNYFFVVNNDDGIGQGGRDIFVRFRTENGAVSIETQGLFHDAYEADSGIHGDVSDGAVIVENFTADNAGTGPAAGLLTGATWMANYTALKNGNSFLGHIRLEWPGDTGSANYNGSRINLRPGDRWDWDVMFHEYSHYVQDTFNFENNPGGPHNIGDCIADVHNSKSEGIRLAWGEGWPTFFGTSAQVLQGLSSLNVPRVGDVIYADTGESNFSYSLETQSNTGRGEDNEVAVQRMLWDLMDSNSDGRDNISLSDQFILDTLRGTNASSLSAAWNLLRAGQSNQNDLLMGGIASDHQVGPTLNSPAPNTIVSASNADFSWDARVGCPSSYSGDSFTLVFYNANTFTKVLTVPTGSTSASLTNTQLQTLLASGHQMLWAVEGSNTSSPGTGPYLGESFAVTVNTPPVADAGPDQPAVECASYTTTAVQLDGTGSSDADGDALTYTWTATGISFDDDHSATPTGQFPMGTTTVTLTVSDGLEEDTDTVDITVVDTTPPVVTCPTDVTVECTSHQGTPKDDPQLAPFFAGVSAVDVCDPNPVITDNAPDYFELGATPVTFYAEDDDGNVDSCTATVTVEDTTPPEIMVELNRDCLWPPNHKMAPIEASVTVSDICDPNPTFLLLSITSDEPDNDKGDGNTVDDIQADVGTDDIDFLLRSERQGGGDGRVYTILYQASDMSGNTADDTTYVRVPHDQGGGALCAAGFLPAGTSLDQSAVSYTLVIPSAAGFDASRVRPLEAYVGNTIGVVRPDYHLVTEVTGDGLPDLVVTYDGQALRSLVALSSDLGSDPTKVKANPKPSPLGLHFRTTDGTDYLAPDILALGEPIVINTLLPWGIGNDPGAPADPGDGSGGSTSSTTTQEEQGTLGTAASGPVTVEIYTVLGRRVRTLQDPMLDANGSIGWDGRDGAGRVMPSGMYFYRIRAGEKQMVKKIMLVR
jgi:hypothetical protein